MYLYDSISNISLKGEKLTDDEVDALLTGIEDSQGQVNYEGMQPPCCIPLPTPSAG